MSLSYTPDEVLALAPALERMGAALLPETCEGRFATYKLPGSKKATPARTTNCNQQSLYLMPYAPIDAKGETSDAEFRARGAGFARVCLHDDLIGHWPNFENVLSEGADD